MEVLQDKILGSSDDRRWVGHPKAKEYVAHDIADLVAFGVLYLANANLPTLAKAGKELNMAGQDVKTWYGLDPEQDHRNYIDWPLLEA